MYDSYDDDDEKVLKLHFSVIIISFDDFEKFVFVNFKN